jgi:hypothetical protein
MGVIYAKLTDPQGVPQVDFNAYNTRYVSRDLHATLFYTNSLNTAQEQYTNNYLDLLRRALAKSSIGSTILSADPVEDKQLCVYTLRVDTSDNKLVVIRGLLEGKRIIDKNAPLGDENDRQFRPGSIHMTMYFLPVREEDKAALIQDMNQYVNNVISFGNVYWNNVKESMIKKSFNKIGVAEYREYLSSMSDDQIVEVFAFGHDDTNTDEFGSVTSAAVLAADEWGVRKGAVHLLEDGSDYDTNLRRIASSRGIVPDTDEDLFR